MENNTLEVFTTSTVHKLVPLKIEFSQTLQIFDILRRDANRAGRVPKSETRAIVCSQDSVNYFTAAAPSPTTVFIQKIFEPGGPVRTAHERSAVTSTVP